MNQSIAIMQPYFFPYIGYFQLINAVEKFVVYDQIQYTKEGWINRNRFLQNGKDVLFSIPLKKDSDFLDIRDREIAADFKKDKFLNPLREAYRKAPYFKETFPLVETVVMDNEKNLFKFVFNSIRETCVHLKIPTGLLVSSTVQKTPDLKNKERVIALCKDLKAKTYINAIGGQALYSAAEFRQEGVELKFLKTKPIEYQQFGQPFVPALSIIDVMMFNAPETIKGFLTNGYDLV